MRRTISKSHFALARRLLDVSEPLCAYALGGGGILLGELTAVWKSKFVRPGILAACVLCLLCVASASASAGETFSGRQLEN